MWLVDDFQNFDEAHQFLSDSTPYGFIAIYKLKKKITEASIFYSLYDEEKLIAYSWIMKFHYDGIYRVHESHVLDGYKGRGIGTQLYSYIVIDDNITLISDRSQSRSASSVWNKLKLNSKIEVVNYNALTNSIDLNASVYQNDYMHYMARKTKTIFNLKAEEPQLVTNSLINKTFEQVENAKVIKGEDLLQVFSKPLSFEI